MRELGRPTGYRGLRRYGRRQPLPPRMPLPPRVQVCRDHGLVICLCAPSSLVTQPITPEEHR